MVNPFGIWRRVLGFANQRVLRSKLSRKMCQIMYSKFVSAVVMVYPLSSSVICIVFDLPVLYIWDYP